MNPVALLTYMEPFQPYFNMAGVSEVCINKPGECWVEQDGQFIRYEMPILSLSYLGQFARLVGEYNQREISPEQPILSSVLPNGFRIQFVIEPACEKGSFICSIRKSSIMNVGLHHYFCKNVEREEHQQESLQYYYHEKNYEKFLELAVSSKKNIIISGGTSTGKTTFLNTLLQFIPASERLITIETDREVKSDHPNTVHLLAAEEGRSVSKIKMLDLLKVSLRLRPDRILVSELRAEEAFPYLRAVNSGHPGSLTTLHADSPIGCFDQLAFMVIQSGSHLSRQELLNYARSIIDVVVQIKRTKEGKRFVSEIYFKDAFEASSTHQTITRSNELIHLTQGSHIQ